MVDVKRLLNRFFGVFMVGAIVLVSTRAPVMAGDDRASIVAMLASSAFQWNHGNLDGFMQTYDNSPATIYISAKGIIRGYAAIRAHYATHYRRGMGVLSFSDLTARPLGGEYATITAHYHLAMRDGTHPAGPFSLVLRRTKYGWRIVEDCSP